MSDYLFAMLLGSLLCLDVGQRRLRRSGHPPVLALPTTAIALVLARVLFFLLQEFSSVLEGDWAWLWEGFRVDRLSFFGGAMGVCLGVALSMRLSREKAFAGLDRFALAGALLAAVFRLGEYWQGSLGGGPQLPEGSAFARFPFAVEIVPAGGGSYYLWAIFMAEAVFALIAALVSGLYGMRPHAAGSVFSLTAVLLALPQIICESLRKRTMRWGFVKVEQVLCAAFALILVIVYCARYRNAPFFRRWWPALVQMLGIGLMIADEFAIDGKILHLTYLECYLIMGGVLVVMGIVAVCAIHRVDRQRR